jgi:L-threonylcarbamoyladenylate synthase
VTRVRRVAIASLVSSAEEVAHLGLLLSRGGVAAIPTETFYALAADPFNTDAVERIFRIKGREDGSPLPVLFANALDLERLGVAADPGTLANYFAVWPAPLTVVFPIRAPIAASRGVSTLAVRIPASRPLRGLLLAVGPLTGTSANRSGAPALADPDAVEAGFRREIDVLVDGGRTPGGLASTLLDATREPPVVLRRGAYAWPGR